MKIAIIGAGNMGGSIARGLAKGSLIADSDIIVSNPSAGKLERLKKEFPSISTTNNNAEAATGADIVILAVKPWLMQPVMRELKLKSKQILISVAAGISFEELAHYVIAPEMAMFRLIPNTAISELESMTLVAARNTNDEQDQFILRLFSEMGTVMLIPEDKNNSSHRIGFLRHCLRIEIYPGSYASRHRNGTPPQRRHANDSAIPERSCCIDSKQRHSPQRRNRQSDYTGRNHNQRDQRTGAQRLYFRHYQSDESLQITPQNY